MKIACISLGCPKNQVDLDGMVHILLSAGHETVAELGEADVILVNTCGFIESAKAEAIENILEACSYKQQNPDLKVIVTGCLAERYRSQIEEEIPEVDAVVGCASNKAIDSIVARLFNGEDHLESYGLKKDFPLGGKRVIGTPAHYAYLKIAEGCNNRCHYCAIPGIRGPLHSRDMADCVAEARWLAGEGVKELIVVAQDPTAYGEDWGKPGSICELLDKTGYVDGFSITAGWHESAVPLITMEVPHGAWAYLGRQIKARVKAPVAQGMRMNIEKAEELIDRGDFDAIVMGRPFLADPDVVNKAIAGKAADIRPCVGCNAKCLDMAMISKPIGCIGNYECNREQELEDENGLMPTEKKSEHPEKILVIGAGPSGMEFARVAALRGHKVTIWEKRNRTIGLSLFAATPPRRYDIRYFGGSSAPAVSWVLR